MIKDVEKLIKYCEVCQRNQKEQTINHPALPLKVNGIFDTIGIDLVFGLPETKEWYKGVMVITEYLTKYPFVKPIKGKSAVEIAANLLEYICLFGPPKTILSDQGTEFNNKIVDTLLQRSCEIKQLIENIHEKVKTGIEKKQETQKAIQNNRENITEEYLEPGTKVLIKNDGILNKLQPSFKGPYTVVRLSENKNYYLKDATNVEEKISFPRSKLKVINTDPIRQEDEFVEVEKILDDKIEKLIKYYWVKWKHLDTSHNSWVAEHDFNNKQIINKYRRSKKDQIKEQQQVVRRSDRIKLKRSNYFANVFSYINMRSRNRRYIFLLFEHCWIRANRYKFNV